MTKMTRNHLGFYTPGARVRLGLYRPGFEWSLPDVLVDVVANYARGTGVVVVKDCSTGAVFERDGLSPVIC